jgi:CheY-like chemotaxis protein
MRSRKKILLVDDHESILIVLEQLLAEPHVSFFRAGCGEEAIAVARRERPDVVIVDVCMPGMDGLEVCDAIRKDPDLDGTRILLMSAVIGDNGLREGGEEVGADGYLGKPFRPDLVRSGVAALMLMTRGRDPEH